MNNESTVSYPRERRVEEVLASYLEAVRAGQAPDRDKLLARHPDLADELQSFFADHDLVRDLAEPFRFAAAASATPPPAAEDTAVFAADRLPARFGDYEILEEIARAGMGIVYRARQVSLDRVVALKMVQPGGREPEDLERFLHTEARAVAGLDHPHIVPVYDFGIREGRPFFSMKLIEGGSLDRHLARFAGDPKAAARLVAAAARAVHHAHQRGLLHRDLKPSNMLLDQHGQPHVTDFGLARRVEGSSGQTQEGAIVGTPAYMAPEQAAAEPVLTTAVDVYGLGAVLYELLTGRPPFRAATVLDTLLAVRTQPPPRPRVLDARVDRDLEVICLKCLEKDPAQRYGSAEAVAEELERWLRGEPIAARPASAWEQLAKWAKRRPAMSALVGVAAVLLLAMLGVLAWGWRQAEQAKQFEAQKADAEAAARKAAEDKADVEKRRADEAALRVRAVKAHLALERGNNRLDRGEIGPGLLWLARALEEAPDDEAPLKRSLRRLLGGWRRELLVPRAILPGDDDVSVVAFSPDGKTFATGGLLKEGKGAFVQRWDARSLKPIGSRLVLQPAEMEALQFAPDGKKLLIRGLMTARIWDLTSDKPVLVTLDLPARRPGCFIDGAAFSPDGKRVALSFATHHSPGIWDTATGKLRRLFDVNPGKDSSNEASVMGFSANGDAVLMCHRDGKIRRWDATKGTAAGPPLFKFDGDGRGGPFDASLSADSTRLVAWWPYGPFNFIFCDRVGQANAPWYRLPMDPDSANVHRIFFRPDAKLVAMSEDDGTVRFWDWQVSPPRRTGCLLRHIRRGPQPEEKPWVHRPPPAFAEIAFSPDGKTVVTANDDCRVWDLPGFGIPSISQGRVTAFAFTPDGKSILTANDGRAGPGDWLGARVGSADPDNPRSRDLQAARILEKRAVSRVAVGPDGKWFVTAHEAEIRVWNARRGAAANKTLSAPFPVRALCISADGRHVLALAQQGLEGALLRWDLPSGKQISKRPLPKAAWLNWRFSPRGTYYLGVAAPAARGGQQPVVYETATGRRVAVGIPKQGYVVYTAFSPDDRTLLTATTAGADRSSGEVRLWDLALDRPRGEAVSAGVGRSGVPSPAAFSPDGKLFVTATTTMAGLQLWDTERVRPIGPPLPWNETIFEAGAWRVLYPSDAILQVGFTPDGQRVAAATATHGVCLWPVPSPLTASPQRIRLWLEVATGQELDAAGALVDLDAAARQRRWQRLQELGGPP